MLPRPWLLSFIGWWRKLKEGRKANFSMVALKFAALEALSAGILAEKGAWIHGGLLLALLACWSLDGVFHVMVIWRAR